MKRRRTILATLGLVVAIATLILTGPTLFEDVISPVEPSPQQSPALISLESIEVKGRAPKTGYSRDQFGGGWAIIRGCDVRNIILYRDLEQVSLDDECRVLSGILQDSYTGKTRVFSRSDGSAVQIDHVVALSDAWQKGAQLLTAEQRQQLANDPLELIAAEGKANQDKGDGDAATWLPPNKSFRCQYVARQIAVKLKYHLWVSSAEKDTMVGVLSRCPGQALPV